MVHWVGLGVRVAQIHITVRRMGVSGQGSRGTAVAVVTVYCYRSGYVSNGSCFIVAEPIGFKERSSHSSDCSWVMKMVVPFCEVLLASMVCAPSHMTLSPVHPLF